MPDVPKKKPTSPQAAPAGATEESAAAGRKELFQADQPTSLEEKSKVLAKVSGGVGQDPLAAKNELLQALIRPNLPAQVVNGALEEINHGAGIDSDLEKLLLAGEVQRIKSTQAVDPVASFAETGDKPIRLVTDRLRDHGITIYRLHSDYATASIQSRAVGLDEINLSIAHVRQCQVTGQIGLGARNREIQRQRDANKINKTHYSIASDPDTNVTQLAKAEGVSRGTIQRYIKLAEHPEIVDRVISDCVAQGRRVTVNDCIKAMPGRKQKRKGTSTSTPAKEITLRVNLIDRDIRALKWDALSKDEKNALANACQQIVYWVAEHEPKIVISSAGHAQHVLNETMINMKGGKK